MGNAEVDAIFKPLLATLIQDHYPTEKGKHFVAGAHHDILTAKQNSPAWAAASAKNHNSPFSGDLYYYPVEPDLIRNLLWTLSSASTNDLALKAVREILQR